MVTVLWAPRGSDGDALYFPCAAPSTRPGREEACQGTASQGESSEGDHGDGQEGGVQHSLG